MIEGYLQKRAGLRAVAVLVDVRRGVEDEERQLVDFLRQPRLVSDPKPMEIILVATKVDKVSASARKPALAVVNRNAGTRAIGFSAVTGEGREELWARIRYATLGVPPTV
jgi:GTP-binding protein